MYEDIIPITYKSGSGGNFLCHFLVSAKIKNKELIRLGNAHIFGLSDLHYSKTWSNQTDKFIIDSLPRLIKKTSVAPYYFPVHLFNVKLVSDSFNKSIRIVYDLDDAKDIAVIFYNKFYNNESSKNVKNVLGIHSLETEIFNSESDQNRFKYEDSVHNILFVTWKEYFRGDPEALILKLSSFTNIDPNNFSRESLTIWRTATEKALTL